MAVFCGRKEEGGIHHKNTSKDKKAQRAKEDFVSFVLLRFLW
jgi:hypothetical protein